MISERIIPRVNYIILYSIVFTRSLAKKGRLIISNRTSRIKKEEGVQAEIVHLRAKKNRTTLLINAHFSLSLLFAPLAKAWRIQYLN